MTTKAPDLPTLPRSNTIAHDYDVAFDVSLLDVGCGNLMDCGGLQMPYLTAIPVVVDTFRNVTWRPTAVAEHRGP